MSEWLLTYRGYDPAEEPLREALCTVGNGVFATRGAAPECRAGGAHYPGTYRIGLYDRQPTTIEGRTVVNESLVNLPDWLDFAFRVEDGPWFSPGDADLLDYEQRLDLRQGVLSRHVRFRQGGRTTSVTQRRFVSMADEHVGALETTFRAEDWSGAVEVRSGLDGRVQNAGVARYRDLASRHLEVEEASADDEGHLFLQARTLQSRVRIAQAVRTLLVGDGKGKPPTCRPGEEEDRARHTFRIDLEQDVPATVEKVMALFTSMDRAISESGLEARKKIGRVGSFDELLEAHALAWSQYWRRSEIRIGSDDHTDLTINLYLFHTLQTVSENTSGHDVGVPARGIHGEAYRGHVFWDELFVFPVLDLRFPELTRSLLMYRYRRLEEARWAARDAGWEGAMFPWQSGSNGREESQRLHLNPRSGRWIPDESRFQRHVNVAIPYSLWKHYQVTGDIEFMSFYGAEMLLEIARFWASRVEFDRSLDRYAIKGVIGPDEFHTRYPGADAPGVDNNAYTNVMVAWTLGRALEVLDVLPGVRRDLVRERLGLLREELERWQDITRKMTVPFHGDGIISQFEGYEALEELDWEGYREAYGDIHRLDRILEAEDDDVNRYKASKQADVLMLFYLLTADELSEIFARLDYPFDPDAIPRNIDYYLERTSHGSTLSGVAHAWVLARANREQSWTFFRRALESDISDIQGGTTPEGIHLGAMAGTVDLLQRCYSGLELRGDVLRFEPYLPRDLSEIRFNLQYRDNWLEITLERERMVVAASPSAAGPVRISVRGKEEELSPGSRAEFALPRAPEMEAREGVDRPGVIGDPDE